MTAPACGPCAAPYPHHAERCPEKPPHVRAGRCLLCDRRHPEHTRRCPARPEPCADCGALATHAERCPIVLLVERWRAEHPEQEAASL